MRLRRWLGLLLAISTLGLIPATQDLQASPAGSTEDKIAILDGLATVGNSGEDSSGLSVGDLSKYGEGLAVTYNNWTLEYRKSAYRNS